MQEIQLALVPIFFCFFPAFAQSGTVAIPIRLDVVPVRVVTSGKCFAYSRCSVTQPYIAISFACITELSEPPMPERIHQDAFVADAIRFDIA